MKGRDASNVPSNKATLEVETIEAGSGQDIKNRGVEHHQAEEEAIKLLRGRGGQQACICGLHSGSHHIEVVLGMWKSSLRKLHGLHKMHGI
eukprot:8022888-Heterocapsa_arctica.AAC.1